MGKVARLGSVDSTDDLPACRLLKPDLEKEVGDVPWEMRGDKWQQRQFANWRALDRELLLLAQANLGEYALPFSSSRPVE